MIKLLFLGELDIHASAFLPFLSKHGYDITVVNTSHWMFPDKIYGTDIPVYNFYKNSKIPLLFKGRLELFRKSSLYSFAEKTQLVPEKIEQIIRREGIEIIYGSWGFHSLPEFRLIRKFNLPMVYEFLTYPTQIYDFAVIIENIFNKDVIQSLDGRILATENMLNYMKNIFDMRNENLVFAECYPENFFYKKRLPSLSELDGQPHLIFIGMDMRDVLPQIQKIIQRKIHIHICDSKDLSRLKYNTGFLHTFQKFDQSQIFDGTFATFMTQFDACLVTYNFEKASSLIRFYNSIPNRFSIALTAGIPIVMPRGYLKGCEEIVKENRIGFTYIDYDELKNKLYNEKLMNFIQKECILKVKQFTLENRFGIIDRFLKQIREY